MSVITWWLCQSAIAYVGQYVGYLSLEHFVVILLKCESMSGRCVGNHPFDDVEFRLGAGDRPAAV